MNREKPPKEPLGPKIEWNKVTPLSKKLALILFIVLPFMGFYLGVKYWQSIGSVPQAPVIVPIVPPPFHRTSTVGAAPFASSTPFLQEVARLSNVADVVASRVIRITPRRIFTIGSLPNVEFAVVNVAKALAGPEPLSVCRNESYKIFYKYTREGSPSFSFGECYGIGIPNPSALVIVDVDLRNNSPSRVNGRFFQLFYTVKSDGKEATRLAPTMGCCAGDYWVAPFSSSDKRMVFIVPDYQETMELIYGNYGTGTPQGEEYFSRSEGGFIIDFINKTLSEIRG